MTIATEDLPGIPKDQDGPTFREPWEAEAFALTIRLHEAGHFTWDEWAATLSEEITAAQEAGDADLGDTYYGHWLAALERLCREKGLASADDQSGRKQAWREAYLATPHGQPVELKR